MKTLNFFISVSIILGLTFMLSSCDKDETEDQVTISQAEEASFVDNVYEDVSTEVDNVVIGEGASLLKDGILGQDCPVVTVDRPDDAQFPKTITIDFGEECTIFRHNDSVTRKGKIIVVITDMFMNQGASRTVTFENFYINENKIEGTRTVTNDGANADGFYEFTAQLQNGKVTTEDGVVIEREYTRTKVWIVGDDTPKYHWDDEFLVDGTGSGITSDGLSYTRTITTSILIARSCAWFKSGVVECVTGEDTIVIDYGDGECDNIATRTINGGEEEEFIMQRKYTRRMGSRGNH